MALTIKKLEIENELFCHLGRGDTPQGCFVELDCEDAVLTARYNPEIGNAVPEAVYHRRVLRWDIPPLITSAANTFLLEIKEDAEAILDDYRSDWVDGQWQGIHGGLATDAADRIRRACEQQHGYALDIIDWADAADHFMAGGESELFWVEDWDITPSTTDEDLILLAARIRAEEDSVVLLHLDRFLDRCRDAAAQAADEADDADADDAGEVLP